MESIPGGRVHRPESGPWSQSQGLGTRVRAQGPELRPGGQSQGSGARVTDWGPVVSDIHPCQGRTIGRAVGLAICLFGQIKRPREHNIFK